jgi:hypothetical protein
MRCESKYCKLLQQTQFEVSADLWSQHLHLQRCVALCSRVVANTSKVDEPHVTPAEGLALAILALAERFISRPLGGCTHGWRSRSG